MGFVNSSSIDAGVVGADTLKSGADTMAGEEPAIGALRVFMTCDTL